VIAPTGQKFRFTPQDWENLDLSAKHSSRGDEVTQAAKKGSLKAKKAGRKQKNK